MPVRTCETHTYTHVNLLSLKLQSLSASFSLLTQLFIVSSQLELPGMKEDFGNINQTDTEQSYFTQN